MDPSPPINQATKPQLTPGTAATSNANPVLQFAFGQPDEHAQASKDSQHTMATHGTGAIAADVADINVPIVTTAPPSQFPTRQHVVQPVGFSGADLQKPIETNKWWGNIPIPGAEQGNLFSFPYTLWWSNSNLCGMNIMHTEASQRVYDTGNSPPRYYISPIGIISWNMGAREFDSDMKMSLNTPTQFGINVKLSPRFGRGSLELPLVNGMAFITGIYSGLTPYLSTVGRAILSFQISTVANGSKYKVSFNDGTTWLIYAFPSSDSSFSLSQDGYNLAGNSKFSGYIQIAKIPSDDTTSEATYDAYSGIYVTGMTLFGSTSGWTGTYGFKFTTAGRSGSPLQFALPHHMASFDSNTQNSATGLYLQSTTMGLMRAYTASIWTMTETLPINVQFLPGGTEVTTFSTTALRAIRTAARADVNIDVSAESNLDSQYFAGKALAKYAEICLVANDLLKDASLTATCVAKLKTAMAVFASNQQKAPLCHETSWKGLVSTSGFVDAGTDFGNTYYNDHHYHYGYFVHAAAILGHVDPTWLTPSNIEYVNTLVRDVANPSESDPYFPIYRSFDWFVGHSWSRGIIFSGDGKDEESGSEDYNFAYAMKLWGMVTQNTAMHARGNLMLAVLKRSMNLYMLMSPDNIVQPAPFVPNFVTGILFMNKADYITYFGDVVEYKHGIQMIPLTPISSFIRLKSYVSAEWAAKLSNLIPDMNSVWKGILMANLAIADPATSWDFFTRGFQSGWLDGGASLTWYLTFVAGMAGGSP